ncbi:glycosyltransferase family 4 protein [Patulibacter americanus]|uniref:glycosyltransferase family 4 protein n=1 Tax=Patulibacter americanus TaxID=588672 RepID=UPI0003B6A5BE|nr:glycosyltransferase family 4 protein [Patulibacter americanus]
MTAPSVLTLSWEYPPVVEGGLARHVAGLSAGLVRRGAGVHVLTRGVDAEPPTPAADGVVVQRVARPAPPAGLDAFLAWVDALGDELLEAGLVAARTRRPDVVHGHDWLVARPAAALADALGVPFVTTVHATEHGRHRGWVQKHPQSHVHAEEQAMMDRADAVLVCSAFMRRHVLDVFGAAPDDVLVVRNGIDPVPPVDEDRVRALRDRLAPGGETLVLLAGRLVYEKGFQVALEAFARVRAATAPAAPPARMVVAGSGPHGDELRAQTTRLGLDDDVTFLGWSDDGTLPALYRAADVCLVPSLYEPFGLVALEAMRGGCAVVAGATGGLREVVVDGTGIRVPPDDARALAAALRRLLDEPRLRDRLVTAGARHAARFSWDEAAEQALAAYTRLGVLPRTAAGPETARPESGVGAGVADALVDVPVLR